MSIKGTFQEPQEKDGFKFVSYRNTGLELLIEPEKIKKSVQYIQENRITGIVFQPFIYGNIENIGFLTEVKDNIESITFTAECRMKDISPLNTLENLKYLSFSVEEKIQQKLDFSCFPKLEHANIVWQNNMVNLSSCIQLHQLTIYNWTEQDIRSITHLTRLKNIYLSHTKTLTSLKGIENYKNLEKLELYYCPKLQTLGNFEPFAGTLKELNIQRCKQITDYTTINKLQNLEFIILLSSAPAKNASFLENLTVNGFGNIDINILDGNVKNLLKAPIIFKNYSHFNAKNSYSIRSYKGESYVFKRDAEGKFKPYHKINRSEEKSE